MAVQLQTGIAQPHVVQPALDHFQSRHLLGNEQHRPAAADCLGDHIGDGLRFSGARRTLDHQTHALVYVQKGQSLRAVGVHHVIAVSRRQDRVQVVVSADQRWGLVEPVL